MNVDLSWGQYYDLKRRNLSLTYIEVANMCKMHREAVSKALREIRGHKPHDYTKNMISCQLRAYSTFLSQNDLKPSKRSLELYLRNEKTSPNMSFTY
ncbi:MAG: hypothetical protein NE327_20835 [Lentisphaeraceae bacterium]|nr:hypothetical protein [Lentisphaeraceae bacterium]